MGWIRILLLFIRGILRDRGELVAENLALRQQLAVLERQSKRPRLRQAAVRAATLRGDRGAPKIDQWHDRR